MRRLPALAVLCAALAACGVVRSINPAFTDADAVAAPELVGRWDADTSGYWEVLPAARGPGYRLHMVAWEREGARVDTVEAWLDARAGRLGERRVIEVRPAPPRDDAKGAAAFEGLAIPAHMLWAWEVTGDSLRVGALSADSSRAQVGARGRCATPHVAGESPNLTLTGTAAEVRRAYLCLAPRGLAIDRAAPPLVRHRGAR